MQSHEKEFNIRVWTARRHQREGFRELPASWRVYRTVVDPVVLGGCGQANHLVLGRLRECFREVFG